MQMFDLTGCSALVIGSSMGIAFALARGLAQAGATVVLNARGEDKLAPASEALRCADASVHTLVFDVTDHDAARTSGEGFEADHGPIDILINNAGMQPRALLEEFPADMFERLLQTNSASVFHVGQACARHMIGRGREKIGDIASVQTALARSDIAPYTATKGAVANLTKGMATDLARHGLQRNAIAPGYSAPRSTPRLSRPTISAFGWKSGHPPAAEAGWKNWSAQRSSCAQTHPAS